jgi:hypothetical protein
MTQRQSQGLFRNNFAVMFFLTYAPLPAIMGLDDNMVTNGIKRLPSGLAHPYQLSGKEISRRMNPRYNEIEKRAMTSLTRKWIRSRAAVNGKMNAVLAAGIPVPCTIRP